MNARLQMTVLSDLSANIFAVCLIVLLILLGEAARQAPPLDLSGAPVEAAEDLLVVERRPLDGAGKIRHLYERRRGSAETSLDLYADGLVLAANGTERRIGTAELAAVLGSPAGPVRLNVFSAESYTAVVSLLAARTLPFTEMSVPDALRNAAGDDWSEGFRAVVADAPDLEGFRAEIARLVSAGTDREARSGMVDGNGSASTPAAGIAERLIALLRGIANVVLPLLALGAIAAIELRHPRPISARLLSRRQGPVH